VTETSDNAASAETTKVESPVIERGGYIAGDLDVADFPLPPTAMTVHVYDSDQGTASEQATVTPASDEQ
jgi:hypothetical protein